MVDRFQIKGFRVQARPGAAGRGYEIGLNFYGFSFPAPDLDMPSLGQGFKGYNRWKLIAILIKTRNTSYILLGETALN